MDINIFANIEQKLDDLKIRVEALERVAAARPDVELQPDPSRSPGVRVAPAPAPVRKA